MFNLLNSCINVHRRSASSLISRSIIAHHENQLIRSLMLSARACLASRAAPPPRAAEPWRSDGRSRAGRAALSAQHSRHEPLRGRRVRGGGGGGLGDSCGLLI
ncbi:hypothetical protein FQA47_006230 [Oryzias melastigma]|uniref:Uncharacterized protein n=1 Tax=Oryzias melastigma TaxID=30732 RepID=A0A834FKM1_ORYME|nr:hypothetical protein FQA47_006230 [Oryzias melastigma]